MTLPARPTPRSAPKSGIALVVVLGLLSMLVVLAVAFFVSMRTERIAARGYSDQIRARNIAMTGIARAIADVDSEMNGQNRVYPNWPNEVKVSTGPGGVLYTADYGDTFVQQADLAWTNIPASLLPGVVLERPNIQWVTNCLPAADGGNLVGRYAYMVINCSGLYDVNRDHSLTNKIVFTRGAGTNACEISVTNVFLGELTPTGFCLVESRLTGGIVNHRNKIYTEATSVADLYPIGRNYGLSALSSTVMVSNLFVYSKAPRGYADANLNSRTNVWIGGTETDVSGKRTDIEAAFVAMGMPANEASMMAANVIDYVDVDSVPGGINGGGVSSGPNCDSFATEAVPMLHQFRISGQVDPAAVSGYTATLKLKAQAWYPFININTNGSYSLRAELVVNGNGYTMAAQPAPVVLTAPNGTWNWEPATAGEYASSELTFTATTANTNGIPTSLTIRKLEVINTAGQVVDRVTAPPAGTAVTLPWATFFSSIYGEVKSSWWWCCDPRTNWLLDPAATVAGQLANGQWKTGAVRADADPDWTTHHLDSRGESGRFEMYVRNQGNLVTVGELGLLVCSNYVRQATTDWQTLRLMDTAVGRLYPVFDYFTADVNPVTYGLVNPINPVNYRPMASVFLSTPVERYPGEGDLVPTRIDIAQATQLGQRFMAAPLSAITNRSDIGKAAVGAFQNIVGLDELQQESVLRNSGNLISPRQNMFIILVIGQAITDSNPRDGQVTVNNGEVRGEANAMALVWRDPYKVNGRNRYSIRWIKWWREDGGP